MGKPAQSLIRRIEILFSSAAIGVAQRAVCSAILSVVNENDLSLYRNRWIAIEDDGTVVADADDLDGLLTALTSLPDSTASIQRVPAVNAPLFIGLP